MTVLLLTADISRGRLDIRSDMLMMAVLLLTAYIHHGRLTFYSS